MILDTKLIVSAVIALFFADYLRKSDLPRVLIGYIIPIIIMYVSYNTLTVLLPSFNKSSSQYKDYVDNEVSSIIDSIGYLKIFPVFLLTLVILFTIVIRTMKK